MLPHTTSAGKGALPTAVSCLYQTGWLATGRKTASTAPRSGAACVRGRQSSSRILIGDFGSCGRACVCSQWAVGRNVHYNHASLKRAGSQFSSAFVGQGGDFQSQFEISLAQQGKATTSAPDGGHAFIASWSEAPGGARPVCLVYSCGEDFADSHVYPGTEFLVGGLAYLTGFELRDAVIASTATRIVEILVIFLLGGFFTHRLSNEVMSSYEDSGGG